MKQGKSSGNTMTCSLQGLLTGRGKRGLFVLVVASPTGGMTSSPAARGLLPEQCGREASGMLSLGGPTHR